MSIINQIEDKAIKYLESGLGSPDFAYLSTDMYNTLQKSFYPTWGTNTSMGLNILCVHTTAGEVKVERKPDWPDGSIVVGNNPILIILAKLGDIL